MSPSDIETDRAAPVGIAGGVRFLDAAVGLTTTVAVLVGGWTASQVVELLRQQSRTEARIEALADQVGEIKTELRTWRERETSGDRS